MLAKKNYANGQKVFEFDGKTLTYFFKNGTVKAEGLFLGNQMEGEWKFYRETGQLWQVGNFRQGKKHGTIVRFDLDGKPEYQESFEDGKLIKKK